MIKAPHPTTAAECSAQQALVQALNALDVAWTQLRTLQLERKPSREFVLRQTRSALGTARQGFRVVSMSTCRNVRRRLQQDRRVTL